jgi:hypothetical protein
MAGSLYSDEEKGRPAKNICEIGQRAANNL